MSTRKEAEEQLAIKALKDPSFRAKLKANPKAVIAEEFNTQVPDDLTIEVVEETATKMYLVLPAPEAVEEELSEEQLEAVAGGGCWIAASRGCAFVTRT
uniref:Proteusin family (NHLP leader peptide) n=1 Tax=Oscillatoria sp. PCC 6602 TaxID=587413 RepID=A0A6H1V3Q3_9CYAN|nr:proteusin family (NHLP leader peptide) precursor [Oscillatoria sp. PCC 6602]